MKQKTDLTLPEWAFLDAKNHTGDALEGRDVLLHVRTNTMLEFFSLDDLSLELNPEVKQREFTYKNYLGISETHVVAVHYSLTEFSDLEDVIDKAITFFTGWMDWMDKGIEQEDTYKHN